MQSKAIDVDAYLAEVPDERRPVLEELRRRCRELLVGFDEQMAYGMPTYSRGGEPLISFASQKQHLALYVMRAEALEPSRPKLADVGGSCVRYKRPEQIDFDVVDELLRATAALSP